MQTAHLSDDRLANLLGALALTITDRTRDAICSTAGSSTSATSAIIHLSHAPPNGIETLRRVLALSHSATVRLIDRLSAEGLVERAPAGRDRRSVVLSLTERGREVARIVERDRLDALRRTLEATLSSEQRLQLTALVEIMLNGLTDREPALWRICRLCCFAACPDCPVAASADA
jgi:DNA-binding MarR family transcriptional regulator